MAMRGVFALVIIAVMLFVTLGDGGVPIKVVECLEDELFVWTSSINAYFSSNPAL